MCDELAVLKASLCRYASRFDAALLSPSAASVVVDLAAGIEASAAALKALAAARAADGRGWRSSGHRSAAEELAARTGTTLRDAKETLATGRNLAIQPEVAEAALSGELSAEKTAALAGAGEAAAGLVDRAKKAPLSTVREDVGRAKAAGLVDLEARRRAVHRRRALRAWTDPEGCWHLSANGCPEDGAQVMAVLSPLADVRFDEARQAGEREDPAAYRFDAFVALFRRLASQDGAAPPSPPAAAGSAAPSNPPDAGTPGAGSSPTPGGTGTPCAGAAGAAGAGNPPDAGSPSAGGQPSPAGPPPAGVAGKAGQGKHRRRSGAPVKLIVRVDYDTFLRGTVLKGETCELVGYGPVPVSVVHDLLQTGDPFVAAVLTKAKQVVGVAHLGRKPNVWQCTALEWLYPSCAAEGCPVQAHLQKDHREDWARTYFTAFDLLDLLCAHHHGLKTRDNWSLVEGTGKRPFVTPDDPRHPRLRYRSPPEAA